MDEPEGTLLASCEHFRLEGHDFAAGSCLDETVAGRFVIATVVDGELGCGDERFGAGDFFLVPPGGSTEIHAAENARVLLTTWPH